MSQNSSPPANKLLNILLSKRTLIVVLFVLVGGFRLYQCFGVPTETTDAYRNIGYSSHLTDKGFSIYETKAMDFRPEPWSNLWYKQGYIYPPLTLVFFALFGTTGLGIFYVKLVLTLLDLLSALLFSRAVSPWAGLLFFSAPVSIFFTSHEGQFEALQTFTIIATVALMERRMWTLGGIAWAASVQTKIFGLLLLPYLAAQLYYGLNNGRKKPLAKFLAGALLGIVPFAGFYIETPGLLLLPFQSLGIEYNPFAWDITNRGWFYWHPMWLILWNFAFSVLPMVVMVYYVINRFELKKCFEAAPGVAFWELLKSLKWANLWYTIVAPGFYFCLARSKRLVMILLVLHFLQDARSMFIITGNHFGGRERQSNIEKMKKCLYTCRFSSTKARGLPKPTPRPSPETERRITR